MDIPISRTKIALPTRRTEWLTRPRLLELFYELLDYKLILVTAPAGYGKTTFMADVAHQIDIPTCWFSLDELDQEPARFITHFIASIATQYPGFGAQAMGEIQNQSEIHLDRLSTILANEVYDLVREHFLIVLDDYYLVEPSAEVREFISLFIQRTDENCHLALLTRKLPDLPDLTLLVGRTQVGGLSFRELAFTPGEIKSFIQKNYKEDINDETVHALTQQTEGWVTGLLLSAQSRWSGVNNQLRVAQASGIDLSAYLMVQVLSQQPDYLCYFLLQSSLLEEFNAAFCQRVLGESTSGYSWSALVGILLEKNLFVQPLENGWLRYHHLFRDFLQNQIEQKYPDEFRKILYRLAAIYAQEGKWEKSRAIYLRLDDQETIAQLVEDASQSLAQISRYQVLATWIDALPYELRSKRPALISIRGITAVMLGDVAMGIELLLQAEDLFRKANETQGVAQALIRRGFAYYRNSEYANVLECANTGLSMLDGSNPVTKGEALRVIGLAQWRMGDIALAAEYLEKSYFLYQSVADRGHEAILLIELGIIYRASGRYNQAEEAYERALSYWKSHKVFAYAAYTANNLGVLYHYLGKYKNAAECLEEAIEFAEQAGDLKVKALAYCSLGDLYADLEIPEATRTAFTAARPIAQRIQDHFILLYLELAEARLAHFNGGTEYAIQLLKSAETLASQKNSVYELGLLELTRGQMFLEEHSATALTALERALAYFKEGQQKSEFIITNFLTALCKYKLKQEDASGFLIEALHLAESHGTPQSLVVAAYRHKGLLRSFQTKNQVNYILHPLMEMVAKFEKELPQVRRELRQRNLPIPLGPPKIVIQGLGANKVWGNGVEISNSDWQTVRARDIFFFILENPEGVSREKIEVTFWPESSTSQLKFTFKKTMYRLRRAFENDPLVFSGERYTFDYQGDYEYDVEELEKKLKQVDRISEPTEKIPAMEDAIRLYQGPYLPEVEGLWVVEKREYLARRFQEMTLNLGEAALKVGNYTAALEHSQTLLSADPCNEVAHRLAMRTYASWGIRSEIVHQFELCKQALMQEFGLDPSPETLALYKKLIS